MIRTTALFTAAGLTAAAFTLGACDYRTERVPAEEPVIGTPIDPQDPVTPHVQPVTIISMTDDMRFQPETINIRVGQTVEWRNTSGMPHTVTFDPELASDAANVALPEGVDPFDSGRLSSGQVYRHTFDVPGRYRYVCLPHEEQGMTGEIIVEGP